MLSILAILVIFYIFYIIFDTIFVLSVLLQYVLISSIFWTRSTAVSWSTAVPYPSVFIRITLKDGVKNCQI